MKIGPYEIDRVHCADVLEGLKNLPDASVHCVVTSPPFWGLRDYGVDGQLGLEATPDLHVEKMVEVFREVRRVLRDDGTLWLNYGDCYATGAGKVDSAPGGGVQGHQWKQRHRNPTAPNRMPLPGLKPKDLVGVPWRVAFALQADGWYLRCDIVWQKPNPMPESVTDRPTRAHEYVFLMTKAPRYFYDTEAIREPSVQPGRVRADQVGGNKGSEVHHSPGGIYKQDGHGQRHAGFNARWEESPVTGRNKRSVWTISTKPYKEAHFATFPPDLVEPCVRAGTSEKGCCATCGAPWRRIVEKQPVDQPPVAGWDSAPGHHGREKRRKHDTGDRSQGQRIAERRDEYRAKGYPGDAPPIPKTTGTTTLQSIRTPHRAHQ